MNFPVFDLHCDTAMLLADPKQNEGQSLLCNTFHIDLERGGTLPGYCQCFAMFTTQDMAGWGMGTPEEMFQRELQAISDGLAQNSNRICQAFTAEGIRQNLQKGIISAVFTIEGPGGFGYDPQKLEELYRMGFRISTLGWNDSNPLTGSHATGGGLTDLGREYVKEAQRLGMLIDVSHISDQGFWDIMEITQGPILASHSNSRSICSHSRNLTDDMFSAICETGGVAGMNLYVPFVGGKGDLDAFCDHVLHFLELDPQCTHIGLGGDLDGCDTLISGISGIGDYPLLADALRKRGLSDAQIYNIFWNNALRVLENRFVPVTGQ